MITILTRNLTGLLHHSSLYANDVWKATDATQIIHLNASSLDFGLVTPKNTESGVIIPKVHLNSEVPFTSALVRTLRDKPALFLEAMKCIDVQSEKDFHRVTKNLYNLYHQALTSLDHDMISLDEEDYAMLGALYLAVLNTASTESKELWADDLTDRDSLAWGGKSWGVNPYTEVYIGMLSSSLKEVTISEMSWRALIFRASNDLRKSGDKGHFILEISNLERFFKDEQSLYSFIEDDYMTATFRGNHFTILIDKNEANLNYLKERTVSSSHDLHRISVNGSVSLKFSSRLPFSNQVGVLY